MGSQCRAKGTVRRREQVGQMKLEWNNAREHKAEFNGIVCTYVVR